MEKFFEVKGTLVEKLFEVFLKVMVIPVLIIALPTIVLGKGDAITVVSCVIAVIYLFVFYFEALRNK